MLVLAALLVRWREEPSLALVLAAFARSDAEQAAARASCSHLWYLDCTAVVSVLVLNCNAIAGLVLNCNAIVGVL